MSEFEVYNILSGKTRKVEGRVIPFVTDECHLLSDETIDMCLAVIAASEKGYAPAKILFEGSTADGSIPV